MSERIIVHGQEVEAERLQIISSHTPWAEYLLSDGAVLRVQHPVISVHFVPSLSEGWMPIYQWTTGCLIEVIPPATTAEGSHADLL